MLREQKRPIPHRKRDRSHLAKKMSCPQYIQRKVARERNSSHVNFVEECLHHNANFKVAQGCQHGVPHVVLVIFKAFLRRECGRSNGSIRRARWEMTDQADWASYKQLVGKRHRKKLCPHVPLSAEARHSHICTPHAVLYRRRHSPDSKCTKTSRRSTNCCQFRAKPFLDQTARQICDKHVMMGGYPFAHHQFLIKSISLHSRGY